MKSLCGACEEIHSTKENEKKPKENSPTLAVKEQEQSLSCWRPSLLQYATVAVRINRQVKALTEPAPLELHSAPALATVRNKAICRVAGQGHTPRCDLRQYITVRGSVRRARARVAAYVHPQSKLLSDCLEVD